MVDKIYIKIICIAKVYKYPPKQNIQKGPKSEMVYPGIFDLIAKNAILVFFFFKKAKKVGIINYTIFLRLLDLRKEILGYFNDLRSN